MADEKKVAETETEEMVSITIPIDPYSQKKSNTIRLSLNGKVLKLERGMTHKVPKSFADLYNFKLKQRMNGNAYARAQLAENNQPK